MLWILRKLTAGGKTEPSPNSIGFEERSAHTHPCRHSTCTKTATKWRYFSKRKALYGVDTGPGRWYSTQYTQHMIVKFYRYLSLARCISTNCADYLMEFCVPIMLCVVFSTYFFVSSVFSFVRTKSDEHKRMFDTNSINPVGIYTHSEFNTQQN